MYSLGDQQQRYNEFLQISPTQLEGEAALLRVLIERAAKENRPAIVGSLVGNLVRVSAVYESQLIKSGELLERATFLELSARVGRLLGDCLAERGIPNWEIIIEDTLRRIPQVLEQFESENEVPRLPAPAKTVPLAICDNEDQHPEKEYGE